MVLEPRSLATKLTVQDVGYREAPAWPTRQRRTYNAPVAEHLLIIGGVAAGLSAASRARKCASGLRITVLEKGPVAAYGACGLPFFLAGQVAKPEDLIVHSPDYFQTQRGITVLTQHEALAIVPGRRQVITQTPAGEATLSYDRLVVATGAQARLHLPGDDLKGVFESNTWGGALRLDAALREGKPGRVAVIGAGYIGLEVAAALRQRGLEVLLLDRGTMLLNGLDGDVSASIAPLLARHDVLVFPSSEAVELLPGTRNEVVAVRMRQGTTRADLVVNCGGLRPNVALAKEAGIALGVTGAIAVDERQQTNLPGVYAAGDCAETTELVSGRPTWVPLGTAANKQGRVAGQNAGGGMVARFPGVLGTLAVRLFDFEVGRTGLSTEQAQRAGFNPVSERIEAPIQAGYLTSGESPRLTVKIIYDRQTERLLGCQMLGPAGSVAGRLDAAAVALTARLTLEQIEMLDLAYSPPLAPLYEPLLIAAHRARGRA